MGDLITSIRIDTPVAGYVYGVVHRTQRWGFFERRDVRFLEQKDSDQCFCECCRVLNSQISGY